MGNIVIRLEVGGGGIRRVTAAGERPTDRSQVVRFLSKIDQQLNEIDRAAKEISVEPVSA